MSYASHSLTPEEEQEILRYRRENGYPLHSPPHPIRIAGCYLITAACYQHVEILQRPSRRTEFEVRLLAAMQEIHAEPAAWVVLPSHYDILIRIDLFEPVPLALKNLHGVAAHDWNREDGRIGKRQVWYRYFDRYIRDETQYFRTMNYIHANPLKHGCVNSPYDWPWSSLGIYEKSQGKDWLRETWKKFPPNDESHEWGE